MLFKTLTKFGSPKTLNPYLSELQLFESVDSHHAVIWLKGVPWFYLGCDVASRWSRHFIADMQNFHDFLLEPWPVEVSLGNAKRTMSSRSGMASVCSAACLIIRSAAILDSSRSPRHTEAQMQEIAQD